MGGRWHVWSGANLAYNTRRALFRRQRILEPSIVGSVFFDGRYKIPQDIDTDNDLIEMLFYGEDQ